MLLDFYNTATTALDDQLFLAPMESWQIGKNRRNQTFHLGVNYINYGSFDGYDENGMSTGTFTGNEAALSFGHARQIGYSDFYAGANLKLINSNLFLCPPAFVIL